MCQNFWSQVSLYSLFEVKISIHTKLQPIILWPWEAPSFWLPKVCKYNCQTLGVWSLHRKNDIKTVKNIKISSTLESFTMVSYQDVLQLFFIDLYWNAVLLNAELSIEMESLKPNAFSNIRNLNRMWNSKSHEMGS